MPCFSTWTPLSEPWRSVHSRAAPAKIDTIITTTGGYTLKLTGDNSAGLLKMKFTLSRLDKQAFTTKSYGIRVDTAAIPVLKGAEFYHADGKFTAGSRFAPFVCPTDGDGNTQILLGFADQAEVANCTHDGTTMKLSRPATWETDHREADQRRHLPGPLRAILVRCAQGIYGIRGRLSQLQAQADPRAGV